MSSETTFGFLFKQIHSFQASVAEPWEQPPVPSDEVASMSTGPRLKNALHFLTLQN